MGYLINKKLTSDDLLYANEDTKKYLTAETIIRAIEQANLDIKKQYDDMNNYVAPLLRNIPLKNFSGAMGECLGVHLSTILGDVKKNPHEAGAPDFIPVSLRSDRWFTKPTQEYYAHGGFDTKASYSKNKKFMQVSASSHHNQTSTVLVVQWVWNTSNVPEVIGVFYTNKLTRTDWKLSRGKPGSKTTNAAALTKTGKEKLRSGWVVLRDDVKLPSKKICEQYGL